MPVRQHPPGWVFLKGCYIGRLDCYMKQEKGMYQRSLAFKRLFYLLLSACLFIGSLVEFTRIAWGTGIWLGQLALSWALTLFLFAIFCILCLVLVWVMLWTPQRLERAVQSISSLRDRLGVF